MHKMTFQISNFLYNKNENFLQFTESSILKVSLIIPVQHFQKQEAISKRTKEGTVISKRTTGVMRHSLKLTLKFLEFMVKSKKNSNVYLKEIFKNNLGRS